MLVASKPQKLNDPLLYALKSVKKSKKSQLISLYINFIFPFYFVPKQKLYSLFEHTQYIIETIENQQKHSD